jgi:hypothetical protein
MNLYRSEIERALGRPVKKCSYEDVLELVLDGKAQVWEGENSIAITEILNHPLIKEGRVWIACGDLDEIVAWQPIVEKFFKLNKCDIISQSGRDWSRLVEHDYKDYNIIRRLH